jgi:exosortase E/protease (VPEID-CTERM system)
MATLPRAESTPQELLDPPSGTPGQTPPSRAAFHRFILGAVVLAAEALILAQIHHPWLHLQQVLAAPIVFTIAFLFFARRSLQHLHIEVSPLRLRYLVAHLLCLAAIGGSSAYLLLGNAAHTTAWIAQATWWAAILFTAPTLAATLFPLRPLLRSFVQLWSAAAAAALTTVVAITARIVLRALWNAPSSTFGHAMQTATFTGVRWLLERFYTGVIAIPGTALLGTSRFQIIVAGTCSGIEGLALILIFITGWLIVTRRELRLARALLLLPIALVLSWLLNLVRIAALIAIGDAGHPALALNGFHSEAGWILFNLLAIGFLLAVQHIPWLRKTPSLPATSATARNIAASYLVPFLAILATSLLTHAASSGFEWLYPLRLLVGIAVLWYFRSDYLDLNWRFSWPGPLAGAAVFAAWILAAHWLIPGRPLHTFPTPLTLASPWQRDLWLAARTLSAIAIVPITEELAFRGYIARRIVSADVESVPFARLTLLSIIVSSTAFGLLHGSLWPAGILAGILFALVAKARNRIGEAVAAHATANLLLAAWVLTRGDFTLW